MKLNHTFTYLLPLSLACLSQAKTYSENTQAIIIDTDIFGDVDDVGALYVANILHNCGLADLRGVAVNTNSQYGALAVSVSNSIPQSSRAKLTYSIGSQSVHILEIVKFQ